MEGLEITEFGNDLLATSDLVILYFCIFAGIVILVDKLIKKNSGKKDNEKGTN